MNRTEADAIIATLKPGDVVAKECKHVTYTTASDESNDDMLSIKEYLILADGRRIPNMRFEKNYKRPYWVTKPHFRTHPDKIQFEDLARVDMFRSTQRQLRRDICFRLGHGDPKHGVRMLARSQFLYGLDAGPEVFMKQTYAKKWPGTFTPNKVTVVDSETDVFGDWSRPILWSVVSDDGIELFVAHQEWCPEISNYTAEVLREYKIALADWQQQVIKKLKNKETGEYPSFLDDIMTMPVTVHELTDHYSITRGTVEHLHETQPDIVTGWNVMYDVEVIRASVEHAGIDPVDLFSDTRVPYEFRNVFLKKGEPIKRTASGREMRLDPQERWDIALTTSSWRIQDAMQTYWQLRKAKGKESGGYGLDAVLTRQLGVGKVKYDTEDSTVPSGTLPWHMDMQKNHKVRYGVYNIFDSLGLWVLDKKNSDLSSQISMLAGPCDYSKFNSQPTINAIDMMFSIMKRRQKIICATSDQMADENDAQVMGKDGWIVTFPSHNVVDSGLFLFEDMPNVQSMIHVFCSDADVETTYPTAEIIQNLSKETTMFEPSKIRAVGREVQRHAAINMTGAQENCIEIVQTVCKMPSLDTWVEQARKDLMAELA